MSAGDFVTHGLSFRSSKKSVRVFLLLAAVLSLGCASYHHVSRDAYLHMIAMDSEGKSHPLVVDGDEENLGRPQDDIDVHVDAIVQAIQDSGKNHLLFYIHGGLVSMATALEHTEEALVEMEGEDFYPIFVNWETGMDGAYLDHLFLVRQGQQSPGWAFVTFPFVLLADMGRAVVRLPISVYTQTKNFWEYYIADEPAPTPEGWENGAWLDHEEGDGLSAGNVALGLVLEVVPGVVRVGTTPLLDGIGQGSFLNMLRRARVLFRTDEDFAAGRRQQSGGLAKLMDKLWGIDRAPRERKKRLEELEQSIATLAGKETEDERPAPIMKLLEEQRQEVEADPPFRITIIAHSMGTIVANELIRSYSELDYSTIVYMAAACTIREFASTALNYVKNHDHVRFYNLCLHPWDDADDWYGYGALPHGSLLEWIDHFVTAHQTQMDYTLGKWNNIARALTLIDYLRADVRERITVRGFRSKDSVRERTSKPSPHDHGDFNDLDLKFWKEEFWDHRKDPETRDRVPPHVPH